MKTLMMIRRMKEVLTWVWIAVIGTAICLNVCAQTPQDWKGLAHSRADGRNGGCYWSRVCICSRRRAPF